ncbi:MAG: MarR family transcriptional regulator [Solirubrobacterales bacterium]
MQATAAKKRGRSPGTAPAPDETALRLGAFLRHLFVFDRGNQLRAMEESGLSLTQCKALLSLSGAGEARDGQSCPGKELAESVGLSVATISRAVDGLVEAGYVTRVEDPEDRRVRRIAITPSGEEVVGRILAARLEGLREFTATLSAAERRRLDSALEKLMERDEVAEAYAGLRRLEGS